MLFASMTGGQAFLSYGSDGPNPPSGQECPPPAREKGNVRPPPREKGFENAEPLLSHQSGMMLCQPSQDDRPELFGLP